MLNYGVIETGEKVINDVYYKWRAVGFDVYLKKSVYINKRLFFVYKY